MSIRARHARVVVWAALLAAGVLASACGAGTPALFTPGPTIPPVPATSTGEPAPAQTADPYLAFAQSLKAAVENNDEAALRSLVGVPWYAGRYKADTTEYLNAADAVAGFRAIRTRVTIAVDLNAAGSQPPGAQKLGERIIVARVQNGNGADEPAFLYASLSGGAWRWMAFVTGIPAEQVSAVATAAPSATPAPGASSTPVVAGSTPSAASSATPTAAPVVITSTARLAYFLKSAVAIRDLGTSRDAVLPERAGAIQWNWSQDGKHAVYLMGVATQQYQIGRIDRDGSHALMLTVTGRHSNPRWSPDGSLILYGYTTAAGKNEVWLMNADGGNKHKLAEGYDAAWSPEGQRIAFASNPIATIGPAGHTLPARNGIHIINVQGKNEWAPITTDTASPKFTPLEWQMSEARLLDQPQWSPDGGELALRVQAGQGAYVTTSATTGGFGKFIAVYFDGTARGFSYSPDGKYITVGGGGQSGAQTIDVYRRAELGADGVIGTPLRELGRLPQASETPQTVSTFAWSPDSTRLAYTLDQGGVWLMGMADGAAAQVNAQGTGPLFWLPP